MSKIHNVSGVEVWVPSLGVTVTVDETLEVTKTIAADLTAGDLFEAAGKPGRQSGDAGKEQS